MREWGAEALTALIKAGLAFKHDPPLAQNQVANTASVCGQKNIFFMHKNRKCVALLYHMNIVGTEEYFMRQIYCISIVLWVSLLKVGRL